MGPLLETYGESLLSNLSVGLIFFARALLGILPLILAVLVGYLWLIVAIGIAVVVYQVLLGVLTSTASVVLLTALYLDATKGKVPEKFPENAINNPWEVGQYGRV